MTEQVENGSDVSPREGERTHGNARFADPASRKDPIDTKEHVRAARSPTHKPQDTADDVKVTNERIAAAERLGVTLHAARPRPGMAGAVPGRAFRPTPARPPTSPAPCTPRAPRS